VLAVTTAPTVGLQQNTRVRGFVRVLPHLAFVACSSVDQVLVSGANVLAAIFLARWLSKPEFGAFAVLLSIFTLVTGVHNALLLEPLSVLGGAGFLHSVRGYVRQVLRLHFGLLIVGAPVFFILGWAFAPPGRSAAGFAVCLAGGVAGVLLYAVLRRAAYVERRYGVALAASVASLSVVLGSMQAMVSMGRLSWMTAFVAQIAGGAAASIVLWANRRKSGCGSPVPMATVVAAHWEYGRWAIGTAIVFWLSAEVYCVLVGILLGSDEAAGFRAVQNLSMLAPNFITALSVLALPRLSSVYAEHGPRRLRPAVVAFLLGSTAVAATFAGILVTFDRRILGLLYGPGYIRFAVIVPPLGFNLVLISASQALQMASRAMNAPRHIFYSFLVSAALTCTIGVAFTLLWGVWGAAVGLCVSTVGFVAVLAVRCRALYGFST
jgi:O-antigen/teichoic acid export membrane protein